MGAVSRHKKQFRVGFSDIDFAKRLKLSSLFQYFQETAGSAVESIGRGIDVLKEKYSVTWVIVRIRVDIERNPVWDEEIAIETWPQKPGRIEFERDFIVRDAKGNIIVRAVSSWVLIDVGTRHIQKSELIDFSTPPYDEERAIDCRFGKLKPFGQPKRVYNKTVGYSDVDVNGHLNNSRYIDFIMDCFDMETHKRYGVKSVEVNFINEAIPGETLTFYKDVSALDSGVVYVEGVNEEQGKTVFKAQVEICQNELS